MGFPADLRLGSQEIKKHLWFKSPGSPDAGPLGTAWEMVGKCLKMKHIVVKWLGNSGFTHEKMVIYLFTW